jgi:non-ribosomal peptide synthetase component F
VVVFQNTPLDAGVLDRAGALGVADVRVLGQTNYPLTLTAIPGARLVLSLGYDACRFDGDAVGRLLSHLVCLLEGMAAGPERRLADLTMLTDAERALVLDDAPGHDPGGGDIPDELAGLTDEELDAYLERLQTEGGADR